MRPFSVSAILMAQAGHDQRPFEIARSETDELRHKVLNDYNAVIACIVHLTSATGIVVPVDEGKHL